MGELYRGRGTRHGGWLLPGRHPLLVRGGRGGLGGSL